MRLRKNDGKSFRLRFTLSPFNHPLIPISSLRVYIPSHSSAGIRNRSNAYTFGICVSKVKNVELHYTIANEFLRLNLASSCLWQSEIFNNLYQVLKTPDISTQSGKTYFLLLTFKEMTKRHVKNRSVDE